MLIRGQLPKTELERQPWHVCQLCGMNEAEYIVAFQLYHKVSQHIMSTARGPSVASRQISVCEACANEGWEAMEEYINA